MCRFDARGYLVRLVFGCEPRVFEIPGKVQPRVWRFANGVSIRDPSMTYALELAGQISRQKQKGYPDGTN